MSAVNELTPPLELLEQLVTSAHILAYVGQGDMVWGHVSVRDPLGRGTWLKGAGHGLEEITSEDVVLIDRAGEVLAGSARRHKEFPIHTEVMAARPDVNCVIHTHPVAPVALAATGEPLRPVSHEACFFVPPELPCYEETTDLIVTSELGERVAATLGGSPGMLLLGHGIVACGSDVEEATMSAVLLDRACRAQLEVLQTGLRYRWTSDEEALAKRGNCYPRALIEQGYAYLARRVGCPV
ncbi:MAG TPA: class II aldolase/adducin family protein [Conexibacter sp.]|jgi:L-fuculose-phosphate aldolase